MSTEPQAEAGRLFVNSQFYLCDIIEAKIHFNNLFLLLLEISL